MEKPIIKIILTLLIFMNFGQSTMAADISEPLAEVKNISQPAAHRYGAGQPQPEHFAEFANAGVKHVINLRPPAETPHFNEAAVVTEAGMAYYNIPIGGIADLTRSNVLLLDKTLQQIGNETALLHCSSSNRVGAIMALRASWIKGATAKEAIALGKQWGLTRLQPNVEELLRQ